MSFKLGIPNKPELADTYYSQFDDEFENNEPVTPDDDDDEDEKTIVPANRLSKKASEEIDEENGEGTMMGEETQDMSEFIGCLQGALRSTTNESTINDDTGIFGPQTKEIKIKNMKEYPLIFKSQDNQ
ncbi:hypothetical protein LOTGIDRAFT_158992 [Lottia gigantea]|uniref:Uncharacterized protein n=1 Tax=Lottia gigantea TaxID=225164 RepID=V4C8X4_LOTGI|nr:hypothetical protein LOTGIDRAFT_158992 [Lottia gigantea]ESO98204.1 hypothetical protein LOTGIDRAFT_158992 [Lottia gigantea]